MRFFLPDMASAPAFIETAARRSPGRFSGFIRDLPGQCGIAAGSNRPASPSRRNFEKFRRRHVRTPGANY